LAFVPGSRPAHSVRWCAGLDRALIVQGGIAGLDAFEVQFAHRGGLGFVAVQVAVAPVSVVQWPAVIVGAATAAVAASGADPVQAIVVGRAGVLIVAETLSWGVLAAHAFLAVVRRAVVVVVAVQFPHPSLALTVLAEVPGTARVGVLAVPVHRLVFTVPGLLAADI
jgi:hypothetical protein